MTETAETSGQTREKVQDAASQGKEKVQETAQQVKAQAGERVREQVDTRSTQAGEQVRSMATAMRRSGEQMRQEDQQAPANLLEQVADRVERLGSYLEQTSGDSILRDLENFGRRQPWVVAAGAFVLGLAGSRFLKASSTQRYESSFDGQRYGMTGGGTSPGYAGSPDLALPERTYGGTAAPGASTPGTVAPPPESPLATDDIESTRQSPTSPGTGY